MNVELQPEVEAMIHASVQDGSYPTADAFLDDAVRMLHEQMAYLAAHRSEISHKIEAGWQSAQRGELYTPEEVREFVNQHKAAWATQDLAEK